MNEFAKLMSMKESDFEKLERLEHESLAHLKMLGAHRLCELDNVCVADDGRMYAITPLECGEEIVCGGSISGKATDYTPAEACVTVKG